MNRLQTPFKILTAAVIFLAAMIAVSGQDISAQKRRVTPVTTAATTTQSINETKNDTARINAARRAGSTHYHDDKGRTIYVDTVSGEEWIDSTALIRKIPMKYPLLMGVNIGVNIWDPVMRAFGQHYGLTDISAQVNMHNRYFPTIEAGLGMAKYTPEGLNYTYNTPMSVFFRAGVDYNFLFNSNPDYKFFASVRYGLAPFKFSLSDITINSSYWGEDDLTSIPEQKVTAGWLELGVGLSVKLWGPLSAGWTFKYRFMLHESKTNHGEPWYIPGYGARGSAISGAFHFVYTIPITTKKPAAGDDVKPAAGLDPVNLSE